MKTFVGNLGRKFQNVPPERQKLIYFVAAFAVIGLILLVAARAAGPFAALEPESANLTSGAFLGNDANASGGSYVQFGGGDVAYETCSSVSQFGIVYTFNQSYPCGQFANGDWWVTPNPGGSTVTITSITPNFQNGQNGWEVNPVVAGGHGFDSDVGGYNASLVPALPYSASPNQSIVKSTTASGGCPNNVGCLQSATVLTVLASPLPGGGADYLRPPYVGNDKPLYKVSELRTDLLPSLAKPSGGNPLQSISSASNDIARLQLDHKRALANRNLHPRDNMPDYGSDIAKLTNNAVGRLMYNDTVQAKLPLLINTVQGGLDRYYMVPGGQTWADGGPGHNMGRKLSILFAVLMLDKPDMINYVKTNSSYTHFSEDNGLTLNRNGVPVWGFNQSSENTYWNHVNTNHDNFIEYRDPWGYIDGGNSSTQISAYQFCCTSQPWKGSAMILKLMTALREIWQNHQILMNYSERWMTTGALYQPDPCAPLSQGGGPLPGNESPADCIKDPDLNPDGVTCQPGKQCGRFPQFHGINAGQGYYNSPTIDRLWDAYW